MYISRDWDWNTYRKQPFIFGGKLLVDKLDANQDLLQLIIGCVFAITALLQLWKMIIHKDAISSMKAHDESSDLPPKHDH